MDLVTARIVTATVESLTGFYGALLEIDTVANDYYVEVPTGTATLAVCRRRFTEADGCGTQPTLSPEDRVILDFEVADADAQHDRVDRLGVDWIMRPTTQPWGARSMMFRDPDGNVVNVFSREGGGG